MTLLPKLTSGLIRGLAVASFALVSLAPGLAQQRRPIAAPLDQFVFEGGGGFTAPAGGTSNQIQYGFNVMAGAGFKESRYLATIGEFAYNRNNLTDRELFLDGAPDGHREVFSVTAEEKVNLSGGSTHSYLIGGGGFYHQLTTLTEPGGNGDIILSQHSTDQLGANVGAGFEHRLSRYSNAKLFAEARYTYLDTPGHSTQLVPVTFGFRF